MRVIIQRVSQANVKVNGDMIGSIGWGLMVLLGVEDSDTEEDVQWLAAKITNMRIFDDEQGVMNLSLLDKQYDILLISQFTLHASTKKGNRPSFIQSTKTEIAIPLYEQFINSLKETGIPIQTGTFGADMKVSLTNDGPVTIIIDSKNKE